MPGLLDRILRRTRPSWIACEQCRSRFVCPIEWETADEDHWRITCRCGACGAWHDASLTNDEAAVWDVELDRQSAVIERAVQRLDRERMSAEVEAFAAALRRDLIDAADFAV